MIGYSVKQRSRRNVNVTALSKVLYTTTFPLTENPISEAGNWENTVSATWNAPVITSSGNATGPTSSGTNDSVARLTIAHPRDQYITAIAFVGGTPAGVPEIELHLRMTMSPDNGIHIDHIDTYEIDIIPGNGVYIVKWLGGQGNIAIINSVGYGTVLDGDIWYAEAVGDASSTNFIVKCNGTTVLTGTDNSANTAGNPGIGFDAGTPADGALLGWKSMESGYI